MIFIDVIHKIACAKTRCVISMHILKVIFAHYFRLIIAKIVKYLVNAFVCEFLKNCKNGE